jgi:predicted O-linked N-acetylglucosamine transferase (SPINDLY family)
MPVLKALAGRAEVFLYPTNERDEPHGQALRDLAVASRGLHRMPTAEAVRMIQADEIDLLVDLSGHTADHRLDIFARRAAPMQATYLGYSGTTGIANMDAILSDELQVPAEEITNFSERPWYIPGGSFTWPDLEIPAEAKLSQPHDGVVFASFNNAAKLSEPCLFQWARLVSSIPGAILLLKNPGFRSERARAHVFEILVMGGMDPRLVRFETLLPTREHFLLYQEVDIALDPWPYGGATTTVETLACGVPVLTLAGSRYTQRMSASILSTVGLTEGITYTLDEWLERGRAWAEDAAWRQDLRQTLPEQTESALRQQALRIAKTLLAGPPLG